MKPSYLFKYSNNLNWDVHCLIFEVNSVNIKLSTQNSAVASCVMSYIQFKHLSVRCLVFLIFVIFPEKDRADS